MARKRMIDPRIWESEDFSKLSYLSRIVWIGLFSNADDEGRGKANSAFIKSQIFPYDDINLKKIEASLQEIQKFMKILIYEVDGKKYYQLTNWESFQNICHPTASQIPAPQILQIEKNSEIRDIKEEDNNQEIFENNSRNILDEFNNGSVNVQENFSPNKKYKYKYNIKEESVKEESETSLLSSHTHEKKKYGKYNNVLLTEQEYEKLIQDPNGEEAIEFFGEYREMKGYKCKNDYLAINKWAFDGVLEKKRKQPQKGYMQRELSRMELTPALTSLEGVEV